MRRVPTTLRRGRVYCIAYVLCVFAVCVCCVFFVSCVSGGGRAYCNVYVVCVQCVCAVCVQCVCMDVCIVLRMLCVFSVCIRRGPIGVHRGA